MAIRSNDAYRGEQDGHAFLEAPRSGEGFVFQRAPCALDDKLVGPIALYPDDLIGIILPGSTYPIEIVQADRYLDKRKNDKNLPVNEAWQDSIKSLLNYPDVVKKMSTDLDWTTDLGEAVVADQGAVLEAVQRFRRQVKAAGNLKSDDKQTVIVEKEVIQVVQANPEVIYVPQYNPSTIVVAGSYPTYGYYPAPYPVYYYPYAPGAAFATGLIWGAAIGAAWSGNHYAAHYGNGGNNNINVNRNTNINTGNINTGSMNRSSAQSAQGTAWKSEKKPGQVSSGSGSGRQANSARVGDAPRGGERSSAGTADRQGAGAGNRQSAGGDRAANQPASRQSAGTSNRGGDAFGGYGSGRDTRADSSRGASSRDSMSSAGRGQSSSRASSGGGGSRASAGGGGGSRSGGGGGARGGRR